MDSPSSSAPRPPEHVGEFSAESCTHYTHAPTHDWQGSEDGHNCKGCPEDSIWRCDRMAHFDPKRLVSGLRPELDDMARQRRQAVDNSLDESLGEWAGKAGQANDDAIVDRENRRPFEMETESMETLKQDEISRQYQRDGARS